MESLPLTLGSTTLRRFEPSDVEAFLAYRADPQLARFQGWTAMGAADAEQFVLGMAAVADFLPGGWIQLAIARAESNQLIGDVGIFLDTDENEAEIGFTLAGDQQGEGHAARAVNCLLGLIWKLTAVNSIRAITDARNTASIRLLERCGFTLQSRQAAVFKGESCTEYRYMKERPMHQGSCHCGAIRMTLPSTPTVATDCNCSLCRRIGGPWVYFEFGTVAIASEPGAAIGYIQGDRTLSTIHCRHCGCVTHWEPLDPEPGAKHGVNLGNFDPELIAAVPVRKFDGADTWKFFDELGLE